MRNYRDLQVWTKAHSLTLELYRLSRVFPRDEIYGITAQLRRAAASIGANLAEGCGRRGNSEFARFVKIALGSASELDYHLLLCRDLKLMEESNYQRVSEDLVAVRKMLTSLLNTIEEEVALKAKAVAKG